MTGTAEPSQYLTFKLDHELYAVDIVKVHEVLEFNTANKIPGAPDFMLGVINLRGKVVPVIDMRLKLGFTRTEKSVDTCVVITEVEMDGEKTVLGALTDAVQEVIELDMSQIAPPPRMGSRIDAGVIRGMGKRDDQFLIILDIDRVFAEKEVRAAVSLAEPTAPAVTV